MKKITIILPVHKIDGDYELMLDNAIESIENFHNDVKLLIVCPSDVHNNLNVKSQKVEYEIVVNQDKTDFCSQVNIGIDKCQTEWFSILEIDDEYKNIWLKSMNDYVQTFTDVDVFLPIVKDINVEGKFLSYTNESVWAYGFSEKQGFLDNEVLQDFQNYQISGGLYKTEKIKSIGKLKDNIKLTFTYELFLRLTHNGFKIMTVPRVGYQHVNFREDSLFWNYKNSETDKLTENEVKFWLDSAKKEFFFNNKRDLKYVES